MRKVLLTSLPLVVIVLLGFAPCLGQQTRVSTAPSSTPNVQRDDELLKLLEITKIQRDAAVEKNKLYEDRLAAKDAVIEAQKGIIDVRDQQLALAKRIDTNSLELGLVAREQIRACEQQLTKADAEIARLRSPSFFKRIFSSESLVGFGIGYGAASLKK